MLPDVDGAYTIERQQAEIGEASIDTLLLELGGSIAAFARIHDVPAPGCVSAAGDLIMETGGNHAKGHLRWGLQSRRLHGRSIG
jgi:hypothetical protein